MLRLHTCNLWTLEAETGGSGISGHSGMHSEPVVSNKQASERGYQVKEGSNHQTSLPEFGQCRLNMVKRVDSFRCPHTNSQPVK